MICIYMYILYYEDVDANGDGDVDQNDHLGSKSL